MLENLSMRLIFRLLRGWIYRQYPALSRGLYREKLAGYERRWGLERDGFTKEGFFQILRKQVLVKVKSGVFFELVCGDGRVGCMGPWLESLQVGWKVVAWEHRPYPLAALRKNRPKTETHGNRLTNWMQPQKKANPVGITSRGCRETSALCREIRKGHLRPSLLGIWNPSRRPIWYQRLRKEGYRLELVWYNMEFYWSERG
jgi:hypothetical protein